MMNVTLKTVTLTMLLLGLLVPITALSQKSDDYFHAYDTYESRDVSNNFILVNQNFGEGGFNLSNQLFGSDLPLGSGLLVLFGAGAVYAVRKRKRGWNDK